MNVVQTDRQCYSCGCDLHQFSESKSRDGQCRACYAAYIRSHKKTQPEKVAARMKANYYLRRGIIQKQNCCLCGSPDSEMHHGDYNKPTDVSWMCNPCHDEYHALERKVFSMN